MSARLLLLPVVAIVASCLVFGRADADEPRPGRMPGLPYQVCDYDSLCDFNPDQANDFGWINGLQLGQTGSVKAKQWTNLPITVLAINTQLQYPEVEPPYSTEYVYYSRAFMVSPKGSKDNYGDSPFIPVRTVAFGSIPVQVTLQISQQRDANNLPVPLIALSRDKTRKEEGYVVNEVFPTRVTAAIDVRVRRLVVDGVDVGLRSTCRAPSAQLEVASEAANFDDRNGPSYQQFDQGRHHLGFYGGTLRGTVDIPAFAGCGTAVGDDISRLLTSALSGDDNPVTIQLGTLDCNEFDPATGTLLPPVPGTNTPAEAKCRGDWYNNNAPGYEHIKVIPRPLPFPTYAPGQQPD